MSDTGCQCGCAEKSEKDRADTCECGSNAQKGK